MSVLHCSVDFNNLNDDDDDDDDDYDDDLLFCVSLSEYLVEYFVIKFICSSIAERESKNMQKYTQRIHTLFAGKSTV